MVDEDLLIYLVTKGRELGANYVEVRYHKHHGSYIFSRMGRIVSVSRNLDEGIGIRVLVNGSLGFASTNKISRTSCEEALINSINKAKVMVNMYKEPIEFVKIKTSKGKYEVPISGRFDKISFEDKIKLHRDLWDSIQKILSKVKVKTFFMEYVEDVEEKTIVTSEGTFVQGIVPRLMIFYNFVLYSPEKGTIQRFHELGGSGGLELLKKWNIAERILTETKILEKVLLEGKQPPKGKIDVVLGSEVVGLMVHESAGHPSEADRILGREAAQAGESFIRKGMLGEKIGSKYSTVIDDPTIPGSFGFYLYDDEGVKARPKYLYKDGVIAEHLHNRWTAKVFNVESNGSARAMNYSSEPIIRMSNTYFKPGDYSFEELIEDIKLGVYIKNYMEWNIDDERWSQRYVGLESYLIENGEIRGFVRNPVIEITTKSFYNSVDAADRSLEFHAGTCGKGEPPQGIPVWMGGPNVRLRNIILGVAPY